MHRHTAFVIVTAAVALTACGGGSGGASTSKASTPAATPTLDTYAVVACRHFHDANTTLDDFLPGATQLNQDNAIEEIPGMANVVSDYQDGITAATKSAVPAVRSGATEMPFVGSDQVRQFIANTRAWDTLCNGQGWVPGL